MRTVVLALLLLAAACGRDEEKPTPAPAPPEVAKINVDEFCSKSIGCILTLGGTFSDGTGSLSSPYSLVMALAEGDAPAVCDAGAKSGTVIQFTGLKAGTAYGLRACVFDGTKYSAGISQSHVTAN